METEYYINKNPISFERASHKSDWKMPVMHYHRPYELFLLEKGSCNILIDEHIIPAEQYDVLLFAPNVLHKNNGGTAHKRTVLYFNIEYLQKYYTEEAIKRLLSCFSSEKLSLTQKNFEYIISQAMLLSQDINNFICLGNILSVLSMQSPANTDCSGLVNRILKYMNNHFNEIDNVSFLAEHFYISKEHLCRSFKKETGLTVTEYLNSIRIRNACDMLYGTGKSITEIGFACGFHSTMYFCKIFKEIVKMTPSEFRKNNTQWRIG